MLGDAVAQFCLSLRRFQVLLIVGLVAALALGGATAWAVHKLEARGALRERRAITHRAHVDSAATAFARLAPVARADSNATRAVDSTRRLVAQARTLARAHRHVTVVADTLVALDTNATHVAVVPEAVVTTLRDNARSLAADSVALLADSVKITTLEQRQPLDSAVHVLATRAADDLVADPPNATGHRGVILATAGVLAAVAFYLLHRS